MNKEFNIIENDLFKNFNINILNITCLKKYSAYTDKENFYKIIDMYSLKSSDDFNISDSQIEIFNRTFSDIVPKLISIKKWKGIFLFKERYVPGTSLSNISFFNYVLLTDIAVALARFHNATIDKNGECVIHGDLHFENIFVTNGSIQFLDVQRVYVRLSENELLSPLYDLVKIFVELQRRGVKNNYLLFFLKVYFKTLKKKYWDLANYDKNLVEGTIHNKKIDKISLQLTADCNLRCIYCYQDEKKKIYQSFENIQSFLIIALKYNSGILPSVIELTGGEPLLNYPVLVQSIDYIKGIVGKVKVLITTNALLLDSDKISYLQENEIDVRISIDNINFDEDRSVSSEQYNELIENIHKALILNPIARMTVTTNSVNNLFNNFCDISKLGFQRFEIQPTLSSERWDDKLLKTYIDQYQKILAMNKKQIYKIYGNFISENYDESYASDCSDTLFFGVDNKISFCSCGVSNFIKKEPYYFIGDISNGIIFEKVQSALESFDFTICGVTCGKPCYSRYIKDGCMFDEDYFVSIYEFNKKISQLGSSIQ